MADYSRTLAQAQRQIAAKGDLVHYQPIADPVPNDPAKPWKIGKPATGAPDPNVLAMTVPCFVVFTDPTSRGSSTQGMAAEFLHGTDVVAGNKQGLLAGGQTFTPRVNDLLIRAGKVYRIDKIKTVDPGNIVILWKLQLEIGTLPQTPSLDPFIQDMQLDLLNHLVNVDMPEDIT